MLASSPLRRSRTEPQRCFQLAARSACDQERTLAGLLDPVHVDGRTLLAERHLGPRSGNPDGVAGVEAVGVSGQRVQLSVASAKRAALDALIGKDASHLDLALVRPVAIAVPVATAAAWVVGVAIAVRAAAIAATAATVTAIAATVTARAGVGAVGRLGSGIGASGGRSDLRLHAIHPFRGFLLDARYSW